MSASEARREMPDEAAAYGVAGFPLAGMSIMAIRVLGAGLSFVAQALASRLIGPDQFGTYALAFVWLLLLGHGATAGTNQLICRFLAVYRVENDPAAAAGLLRFALVLAGCVASGVTSIALLAIHFAPFGLNASAVVVTSLAFAAVPLLVLQDYLEAIARGLDRPVLGVAPALLLRQLAIIFGVGGLMLLGTGADALTIMVLTVGGVVATLIVQALLLARRLRVELKGVVPVYRTRLWFSTALPIAFLDGAEVLFNNADILVLGMFAPPEVAAFYFAATRLSQILAYVPWGISAVAAQKYAALSRSTDRRDLQSLVSAATFLSTALALAASLGLWLMAGLLLSLFGPSYDAALPVLPVLCAGVLLACAFGPGDDVLIALGEERICSFIFFVALAANLALSFALVPAFGMMGAAIASATALGLRGMLLSFFAWRRLGLFLPLSVRLAVPALRGMVA